MTYNGIKLKKSLVVGTLYSIHYFEYMNNFSFTGESHDFWELVCVDKGEAEITSGSDTTILKKGEITFHPPNQYHNIKATGKIAPSLVVISFDCRSEGINFFRDRVLKVDDTERNLLAEIIIEARRCFDCRLDDPYLQNMPQKNPDQFGAEQLILLYLEHFLIHLLRRYTPPLVSGKDVSETVPQKAAKRKSDAEIFSRITDYLEANLSKSVTLEQIGRDNLVGRSQMQRIVKEQTSFGIIEYFTHMKVNAAKEMIRSNQMNFSQIAEHLGYSSIHYFSRQFKQIAGMTPSEYASSIKAIAEGSFS